MCRTRTLGVGQGPYVSDKDPMCGTRTIDVGQGP